MDLAGQLVAFVGSLLILLAAAGVVRFKDVLWRMHALSKATTLGVALVLAGAAVAMPEINDRTSLVLALVLQVVTTPVSSNLIARSIYLNRTAA